MGQKEIKREIGNNLYCIKINCMKMKTWHTKISGGTKTMLRGTV